MHSGLEKGSVMGGSVDLTSMGEFFAERARGGVGLMVTGGVAPNRAGWVSPFAAKLSNTAEMEVRVEGWSEGRLERSDSKSIILPSCITNRPSFRFAPPAVSQGCYQYGA